MPRRPSLQKDAVLGDARRTFTKWSLLSPALNLKHPFSIRRDSKYTVRQPTPTQGGGHVCPGMHHKLDAAGKTPRFKRKGDPAFCLETPPPTAPFLFLPTA